MTNVGRTTAKAWGLLLTIPQSSFPLLSSINKHGGNILSRKGVHFASLVPTDNPSLLCVWLISKEGFRRESLIPHPASIKSTLKPYKQFSRDRCKALQSSPKGEP